MDQSERPGASATMRLDNNRVKEQLKRIQEYVWARHVDGSDEYDHSIGEEEAIAVLDKFYSGVGNRNSPDQVYLGILLFEKAFEQPDQQEALFERAKKIFAFYKKVTGEDDWPAVEDRLEDINAFFVDLRGEEPAPAVEEAPAESSTEASSGSSSGVSSGVSSEVSSGAAVVEPVVEPVAPPAAVPTSGSKPGRESSPTSPAAGSPADSPSGSAAGSEEDNEDSLEEPTSVVLEPLAVLEPIKAPEIEVIPQTEPEIPEVTPTADSIDESAAESEKRREAEAHAARRQATEAFIADLEVVDGMNLVPAGTFIYGSEGKEIFLDSFYIDCVPVTNAEYMKFVEELGYRKPRYGEVERLNGPHQPVVGISLGDARQYARWAGKELPTEQQWEKAARGDDGRPYPWGNDPPGASDACFDQDAVTGAPAPVRQSLRNVSPFGVSDMAGGVWEWTVSHFLGGSDFHVLRGGSYNDPAEMLQVDFRLEAHPKDKSEAVGFRCVKNIHHS